MKKEQYLPVIIFILSAALIIVSLMVFISNGNQYWLKRKLKLGALILTLTASISACQPIISCYDPAPTDYMYIENTPNSEIQLVIRQGNLIKGKIMTPVVKQYSFRITDTNYIEVQRDNIFADDGTFDESTEEFTIKVDTSLNAGKYFLYLFTQKKEDQPDSVKSGYSYKLIISK